MTQAFNLSQLANKVNSSGQADLTTAVTGTLPVANGGSGQTTYTNGQLLIGNTTGNTLTKATLTAGSGISVTNGSGSITIASTASGGFSNMQVFTAPGTFTTPASATQIKVTVVGGGGNGGNPATSPNGTSNGGSGGAGGTAIYVGSVSASTPYSVTVGSATNTSSFFTLASATGGASGTNAPAGPTPGLGGVGGTGTAGTLLTKGGSGGMGAQNIGGTSTLGGGGVTTSPNGGNYGGGAANAGTGAGGVVIVEY